ncbi:MAG: Hemerythrin HHE cation binding domain protein [Methanosaeta sp. PtaB.Bin039]|nr:MAG: Hemerythrin HHE cation binding domain protein [Methanosaeta sp. PtaB.Bin039]
MPLEIPDALRKEHHSLHSQLSHLLSGSGKVKEAAALIERSLSPHFRKEESYALPLLGLLPDLAEGRDLPDLEAAATMARLLEQELPGMLADHAEIVGLLKGLVDGAAAEEDPDAFSFSVALKDHALFEEAVLYPAARLVGRSLKK